jgi:hypothetical protein
MSAALIVVGVPLVTILAITAVLALRWHDRVRRERHEAPADRYRREVSKIRQSVYLRSAPRGWRRRGNSDVGNGWAASMTSHGAAGSAWAAGTDGGCGDDNGDDNGSDSGGDC